ncbi:MAG: FAD-dependent oxidoreductase [Selenomonadaceae bacterium]|nr:FAD-dependent oxidoreductase [Selenomonadaceae bacterium]
MEQRFDIPISRRDFMKLAGLTAGAFFSGNVDSTKKVEASTNIEKHFNFEGANIPTLMSADVCVCGGGPAGTAAAITAAKNGLKVILIEKGISLGGLQTLGCVYPCMPTFAYDSDTPYINELNLRMKNHGVKEPVPNFETENYYGGGRGLYIPELLAEIYDELCEEYGVDILYNTSLIGAITENKKITSCIVQTIEGIFKIDAKIFIDGSGDAILSRFAGVPVEKGSNKTGRNQPMSFRFEMSGIDERKVRNFFTKKLKDTWNVLPAPFFEFAKWKKTEEIFNKGVASGELTQDDILYIQVFTILGKPNTMSMNCPEMPPLEFSSTDTISYSKAISFGRKMMRRLAKFFIKNIPGFENAFISREANLIGVRESWRIIGKYYMTDTDYFEAHKFSDAVCRTAYPIDIHDTTLDFSKKLKKGEFYEIPFRALVTNEIDNLAVVGRCASGSFAAQASFRIQPTCMSMGEAAGIAAAYALKNNISINDVEWNEIPENQRSYVSQSKN